MKFDQRRSRRGVDSYRTMRCVLSAVNCVCVFFFLLHVRFMHPKDLLFLCSAHSAPFSNLRVHATRRHVGRLGARQRESRSGKSIKAHYTHPMAWTWRALTDFGKRGSYTRLSYRCISKPCHALFVLAIRFTVGRAFFGSLCARM